MIIVKRLVLLARVLKLIFNKKTNLVTLNELIRDYDLLGKMKTLNLDMFTIDVCFQGKNAIDIFRPRVELATLSNLFETSQI